jgi:PAS domain-containing protein
MPGLADLGEEMLAVLARMVDAMSEGVLVIDREGIVALANRSAADLFDLPESAAALRPLAEYDALIRDWRVEGEPFRPHELLSALSGQPSPPRRATITTAAGTQRVVRFTATPIADRRGQTILDRQSWTTRLELASALFEYLEIFHNRQRRHSSLGMPTPVEFETRQTANTAA